MIDWYSKVQELKAMADEMDLWAGKTSGHVKLLLGRNADELRRFAYQIQVALLPPEERVALEPPPDWVLNAAPPASAEPGESRAESNLDESSETFEPGEDTDPQP